jgi:hypothetical protein
VQRVQEEIASSGALLVPEALQEYRRALQIYEGIAGTAR